MQNGDHNSQTKISRVLNQDAVDHRQAVNEKDSMSHEPQVEGAAVPTSKDKPYSDTQTHKVRVSLYSYDQTFYFSSFITILCLLFQF